MSNVLVIGATGHVGKMVCRLLINQGHNVRALIRDVHKACELKHPNLEFYTGNLEDDFSDAFQGMQTVIFVAGSSSSSGCDQTLLIDLWAAKRAIDFAEEEPSVAHFIMLSAFGADDPDEHPLSEKPFLIAKHLADEYLSTTSLAYTILRPGNLTDQDPTGFSVVRPLFKEDASISRRQVAQAICACVENEKSFVKVIELFQGKASFETILQ